MIAEFDEGEALRADETLLGGEERAGKAREHRADGEGGELGVGGIDAERLAGRLVLAQRLPGAADRQAADALREEVGHQRKRQDDVIEEDEALVAGERDAHHLGEGLLAGRRGLARTPAPNSVGPGMLPMPAGPLLRSTQFSRTSRMISPKPMVTMAR